MYGYNAAQPMAIPIYTVLPYCVIIGGDSTFVNSATFIIRWSLLNTNNGENFIEFQLVYSY